VCFETDAEYDYVSWYGRGFDENYPDRKCASPFGLYSGNVKDLNVVYEVPQEAGTRCDVSFVRVMNEKENGLSVVGCDKFSFSYHNFSLENLTKSRHKNELKRTEKNYLYIDYKMRGLGSASCGPEPEEEYELRPHHFRFVFALANDGGIYRALELSRTDFGIKTDRLSVDYKQSEIEVVRENFECK